MSFSTYSFADCNTVISHPNYGQMSINGDGIGSITFSRTGDNTAQDIGADGSVMQSKIKDKRGTISITCQQTSELNKWLTKLFNYVETSSLTEDWISTLITCDVNTTGEKHTCTNVSFQKMADTPYSAQGQNVTWNFLCGEYNKTW